MGQFTLFLCGDVMTGRGIDQILRHPGDPSIHEGWLASARDYVALAERAGGPVPRPAPDDYIWGDALAELERARPDLRIVNLESAVTTSGDWLPKGINYRMHPANIGCLAAAGIDCCALANNHVLDWGEAGLVETLATLERAGIRSAGAGRDLAAAQTPAALPLPGGGRLLVAAACTAASGVPSGWAAGARRPGVHYLPDLSPRGADDLARRLSALRRAGDLVLLSIHWGPNWGYAVTAEEARFAHRLVDAGAADIVHGHSSHHPRPLEVYRGRLILYGCGDFINDYEGIGGHEPFRPNLRPMYFASVEEGSGRLLRLALTLLASRRLRLARAAADDVAWLAAVLTREGRRFGTRATPAPDGRIGIEWGRGEGC